VTHKIPLTSYREGLGLAFDHGHGGGVKVVLTP
jgi:hypothetical protein